MCFNVFIDVFGALCMCLFGCVQMCVFGDVRVGVCDWLYVCGCLSACLRACLCMHVFVYAIA